MHSTETAAAINEKAIEKCKAYNRMALHIDAQPEEIARHYLAHAAIAEKLLHYCTMRKYGTSLMLDEVILSLTRTIKNNHLHDFGIALEWPTR